MSRNSSRYPRELATARPLCSSHDNCVDESGRRMIQHKCEAVYMDVPVLVKTGTTDRDGYCLYKSQHERVPIAFTCAFARILNAKDDKRQHVDFPLPDEKEYISFQGIDY